MVIKTASHVAAAALFASLAATSYAQTGTGGSVGGQGSGSASQPSMQQKQPGGGGGSAGSAGTSGPAIRGPGAGGAPAQDGLERREGGSGAERGAERSGVDKNGKAAREEHRGEKQQRTEERQPSKSDGRQAKDRPDGEGKRGAGGGVGTRVDLSSEQRSSIRQRLSGGPRASNVNISVSIGAHVPRSVALAPLPVAVVEIVPQYRGYRYVLVGDRILIVNPRTLEIVAVLDA